MSFLSRLLGRKEGPPAGEVEVSETVCPHTALVPRWDSADDIGKTEKVDAYVCEACQESFSREEGERLKAEEAERVRLLNVERLKNQ
jgi:nitrite reductase/ring-hydroxylating ferredoxin subunit